MWTARWCGRSVTLVLVGLAATAMAQPSAQLKTADVQRLQQLERTELPQAREALQKHLQHCDTLMAVLYTRRALAMTDGQDDSSSSWQDMEVLVTQCKVTANQLRSAVQALEVEQKRLQQGQSSRSAKE